MFEDGGDRPSNPRSLTVEEAGEILLGHRHIPTDMIRPARERAAAEKQGDSQLDFLNAVAEAVTLLPQTVGEKTRVARIDALERAKSAICAAQAKEAYGLKQDVIARHEADGVYVANPARGAGAEVALARKEQQYMGPRLLSFSVSLIEHMPHTFNALERGELNEAQAMILVSETANVDPGIREFVDRSLAGEHGALAGMGPKQLESRVKKEVLSFDNSQDMINHNDATNERRVTVTVMSDGRMRFSAILPAAQGVAVKETMLEVASKRRSKDDKRTDTQVVADTIVERITGQEIASRPSLMINLTMTDRTLLVGDSEPAYLKGYGTISAEYARWLITGDRTGPDGENEAEAWIRRVYTAPTTGELVAMDSKARKVPQDLKDLIVVRDQFCRTPYCDAPIRHIDHVYQAAKGGETCEVNLNGRCAWCNQTKEVSGWEETVVQGPRHTTIIKTPSGQMYRSLAPPLPGTPVSPPGPIDSVFTTSP